MTVKVFAPRETTITTVQRVKSKEAYEACYKKLYNDKNNIEEKHDDFILMIYENNYTSI